MSANLVIYVFIAISWLFSTATIASTYKVCFSEWYPYAYTDDNGLAQGSSIEKIKQGLNAKATEITFMQLPHGRCVALAKSKEVDFALHIDSSDELARINQPVANWSLTFAVHIDNPMSYQELMAANGMTVLMSREYSYPKQVLTNLEAKQLKILKASYNTATSMQVKRLFSILTTGRVDAILIDKRWAELMIRRYQLPIRLYDSLFHVEPQFIGYHPDKRIKASALAQSLRN